MIAHHSPKLEPRPTGRQADGRTDALTIAAHIATAMISPSPLDLTGAAPPAASTWRSSDVPPWVLAHPASSSSHSEPAWQWNQPGWFSCLAFFSRPLRTSGRQAAYNATNNVRPPSPACCAVLSSSNPIEEGPRRDYRFPILDTFCLFDHPQPSATIGMPWMPWRVSWAL